MAIEVISRELFSNLSFIIPPQATRLALGTALVMDDGDWAGASFFMSHPCAGEVAVPVVDAVASLELRFLSLQ